MIMKRSFAEHMGFNWPKEIAYIIDNKIVTYDDLLEEKRKRQKHHLQNRVLKIPTVLKPCFIWVFYNNTDFFGGWWLYVRTNKEDFPIGFRGQNNSFKQIIMELFPSGQKPSPDNFSEWAESFEKAYHKATRKRTKQGMVLAWAIIENGHLKSIIKDKELYNATK